MNLKKEIKDIKGQTMFMSYASDAEIKKIKKEKNLEVVRNNDLPRETIGNMLINCVSIYPVKENRETLFVYKLGQYLIDESEDKKPLDLASLMILRDNIIPYATLREEVHPRTNKVERQGIYQAFLIGQVLEEIEETISKMTEEENPNK